MGLRTDLEAHLHLLSVTTLATGYRLQASYQWPSVLEDPTEIPCVEPEASFPWLHTAFPCVGSRWNQEAVVLFLSEGCRDVFIPSKEQITAL